MLFTEARQSHSECMADNLESVGDCLLPGKGHASSCMICLAGTPAFSVEMLKIWEWPGDDVICNRNQSLVAPVCTGEGGWG